MRTGLSNQLDYEALLYHTFPEFLTGIAQAYADRPAISWFNRKKEEQSYTYREMTDQVRALQEAFCIQNMAGKRVAIISENSFEWIFVFLAAVSCGCIAVCVDIEQSDEVIRDMISRSDAQVVFLSETYLPICAPLLQKDCTKVEQFVLMGRSSAQKDMTSTEQMLELGRVRLEAGENTAASLTIQMDQTAEFVFTSGTTSKPKIVMLSQNAIMQNIHDACTYVCLYDKVFTSLPFYHAYGLNCAVLCSFLQGAHLYINGNLKTVMRDLHLAQPDTMFTVPLMVEAIHNQIWLNAEREQKSDGLHKLLKIAGIGRKLHISISRQTLGAIRKQVFGDLRLIICGGAHLSQNISEEFELLGIQMLQGYGITECSPLISVNRNCFNKLGSVGLPMASFEIKLVDGEVWARGPSVMQGYYKDAAETAEALENGWFKTGDLGYSDKDGFLYLTGRKKNLIVFKNGKKISPEKLEDMLASIPLVKEVMVYGSASGSSADDVKLTASIYPDPEFTRGMTSYDILNLLHQEIARINAALPSYQQIQMITIREKEFAKTAMRKLKRYEEQ